MCPQPARTSMYKGGEDKIDDGGPGDAVVYILAWFRFDFIHITRNYF